MIDFEANLGHLQFVHVFLHSWEENPGQFWHLLQLLIGLLLSGSQPITGGDMGTTSVGGLEDIPGKKNTKPNGLKGQSNRSSQGMKVTETLMRNMPSFLSRTLRPFPNFYSIAYLDTSGNEKIENEMRSCLDWPGCCKEF